MDASYRQQWIDIMRYHEISVLSVVIITAFLLTFPAESFSQHDWDNMQTKHSWNTTPENWESQGHPPAGTTINLHVALKPDRESALTDALYEVSDPGHPKYGAHLSKEQVAELVAPHPVTLDLVNSWLKHHGFPLSSISVTHGGSTLTLAGVAMTQANELLDASYQLYRHVKTNETIVRTIGYSLPAALHGHVWTVSPTTHFASLNPRVQITRNCSGETAGPAKSTSKKPVNVRSRRDFEDDEDVTSPTFLRWLYNTWGYTPTAVYRNTLAIVGFLWETPSQTDLTAFMRKYRTDGADATFVVVQVNYGSYDPSNSSSEANLGLQYAQGIAYPTPLVFYSTGLGLSGTGDWYQSWLGSVLDLLSLPQTISITYGNAENEYSKEDVEYLCALFSQLGARGVSVLVASGNRGVGRDCVTSDGYLRFSPLFPATCPFVTAVGGTYLSMPEMAAEFSSGGFSNYEERPYYQQHVMPTYLQALGNRHEGLFNDSGRGLPDISAQSTEFRTFNNSIELTTGGTSGSAPIVAGIISLLNDYLLSKGKAPLGFLNPWMYSLSLRGLTGFNDITIGSNPGCGTDGFPAATGWDAVTGLGTPDFERLRQILELELSWRPPWRYLDMNLTR